MNGEQDSEPLRLPVPVVNTQAGIQTAVTILALAALPISAWLYIANYVDDRVASAMATRERAVASQIERMERENEYTLIYLQQLCSAVRTIDSNFSCEARLQYRRSLLNDAGNRL